MWAANLQQVHWTDPQSRPFVAWVLGVRLSSGSKWDKVIGEKHRDIDTILADQGVSYTEITTRAGKQDVYRRFGYKKGKHPVFFVLNKHPLAYAAGERLLAIEWGKWSDTDMLRDDLMALVNSFEDEAFRAEIATALDPSNWERVKEFLLGPGFEMAKTGVSVAAALAAA